MKQKLAVILSLLLLIPTLISARNAGYALDFDGDNDRIQTEVDINPSVHPNLTMSAWVYPTCYGNEGYGGHSGRRQVLCHDNGGYDRSLLMQDERWGVFTGNEFWNTGEEVTLDTWQHIAVVYSTSDIKFYKNGVEYSYGSAGNCSGGCDYLWIGDNPYFDEDFPGYIDEVRIWNTALNTTIIQD